MQHNMKYACIKLISIGSDKAGEDRHFNLMFYIRLMYIITM
jgi:hypothetical protein